MDDDMTIGKVPWVWNRVTPLWKILATLWMGLWPEGLVSKGAYKWQFTVVKEFVKMNQGLTEIISLTYLLSFLLVHSTLTPELVHIPFKLKSNKLEFSKVFTVLNMEFTSLEILPHHLSTLLTLHFLLITPSFSASHSLHWTPESLTQWV